MPEITVKIGSVADLSGIERFKGGLTQLQGEIQKKLSLKETGMSLLSALGIGTTGGALALGLSAVANHLNKIGEEAREFAQYTQKIREDWEAISKQRFSLFFESKNPVEQLSILEKKLKDLEDKRTAMQQRQAQFNADIGVFSQADTKAGFDLYGYGDAIPAGAATKNVLPKQAAEYAATGVQKAAEKEKEITAEILELQKSITVLKDKNNQADEAAGKKLLSDAIDQEMNRQRELAAGHKDQAEFLSEVSAKRREAANTVRDMIDPSRKLAEEIKKISDLERAGALSTEEATKAKAKLKAEFDKTFEKAVQSSSDALAGYKYQLDKLARDPNLTDEQKRLRRIQLLGEENAAIDALVKSLEDLAKANPSVDPAALIAQIRALKEIKAGNGAEIDTDKDTRFAQTKRSYDSLGDSGSHYQGAGEGIQGGLMEAVTEMGTFGDQTANTLRSTIGTAVSSITEGIRSWDMTGRGFLKMIGTVGRQVFSQFIGQVVQMGVQWVITQALIKTGLISTHVLGETLKAQSTASTIGQETAKTPILATNAGLASVSSFGVAAILGIALLLAGIAALAFEKGGVIPGGEQLIRVNESGTESVLNADATSKLGAGFVQAANSGDWAAMAASLPSDVAPLLTAPRYTPPAFASGGGGAGEGSSSPVHIAILPPDMGAGVKQWAESTQGRRYMLDLARNNIRHI